MKNKFFIGMLTVATVAAVSCASPVYVEKSESANLAKYRTYSWVDMRTSEEDTKNVTGMADEVVRTAARNELEKKGWRETQSDPDVLLSYDVLVERSRQQQSDPVYSQPFRRVYFNPYMRRWGTVFYPSQFIGYDTYTVAVREGTLTLTMTDAKTDKTVWQGWTTETIDQRKFSNENAQTAVTNILKKLDTQP